MKKTFDLSEANKALIFIKPIVLDIQKTWTDLNNAKSVLELEITNGKNLTEAQLIQMEQEIQNNLKRIEHYMQELEQVGCVFKDFGKGVVDFPSFYKNNEIFLCWHCDEETVSNWHFTDAGFDGRREIDEEFKIWNSKEPNTEPTLA